MLTVAGVGKVNIDSLDTLDEVLHMPKLCINLISVQKISKMPNYSILFAEDDAFLINKLSSQKIGVAKVVKGLYQLQESSKAAFVEASQLNKGYHDQLSNYDILHKRFGHPSIQVLKTMFPSIKTPYPLPLCEVCEYSKHKKAIYPSSQSRKNYPFQLIHSDVWGPIQEESIHGHRWFIVIIDDFSRLLGK